MKEQQETQDIVPRALTIAAKTFGDKPKLVGECLIALVKGTTPATFSEVQRYILEDCRAELADRRKRRADAAARKRAQRERGKQNA
ncbi:MAG TPA: hypothetical protein DD637_04650 [Verrucomicrobia bacterium]|nr:hypothetical protein [Verrucomicrobiota bacterium]